MKAARRSKTRTYDLWLIRPVLYPTELFSYGHFLPLMQTLYRTQATGLKTNAGFFSRLHLEFYNLFHSGIAFRSFKGYIVLCTSQLPRGNVVLQATLTSSTRMDSTRNSDVLQKKRDSNPRTPEGHRFSRPEH